MSNGEGRGKPHHSCRQLHCVQLATLVKSVSIIDVLHLFS